MYKHIVVAVDGSRTSLNALQHASSLAVAGNARLTLITVANPSEYMTLAPEFLQHDSYEAATKCWPRGAKRRKTRVWRMCKRIYWCHPKARRKWRKAWWIMPTATAQI